MSYLLTFLLAISCITVSYGMEQPKKVGLFKRASNKLLRKSNQPITTTEDVYKKAFEECGKKFAELKLTPPTSGAFQLSSEDACRLVSDLLGILCTAPKTDAETIKRGICDAWTFQKAALNYGDTRLQKQIAHLRSTYSSQAQDELITQFGNFLEQSTSTDIASTLNRGSLSVHEGAVVLAKKQEEMKAIAWRQAEDDINNLGINKEGQRHHYSIIKGSDGNDYNLVMPDPSQSHTNDVITGANNILRNNLLPEEYLHRWTQLLQTLRILISHYEARGEGEYLTFGLTIGFSPRSLISILELENKCPQAKEYFDAYINFTRSFRPASPEYTAPQKIAFILAQTKAESGRAASIP